MRWRLSLLLTLLGSIPVATAEEKDFFEKKVRPILVEHCYSCHSEAQKKLKGGLTLDSREAMLQGGDSGPAIIPGDPSKSLLIQAIHYQNADLQMPPKGKLAETDIAVLVQWVKAGASWPNEGATQAQRRKSGTITDEDRRWWAFQPVRRPSVPSTAQHPIDAFIRDRLQREQLTPAPRADKRTLIRRLTFDLTGLPPTIEELNQFLEDARSDAYERLVDRLLASPRYGERLARLWLDLVRYADSDGYRLDEYRPHAWRYRDYVIRAFNTDKPYDRFIQEQLAGDELFPGDPEALIATGYLRHWIYEYNQRDVRTQWNIILDDITDTTADVFLGLGLQCAKCHDHKYDPLLQKDYYRLRAFFAGLLPRDDLLAATPQQQADYAKKLTEWTQHSAPIRAELAQIEAAHRHKVGEDAISKFPPDIQAMIRKPAAQREPLEHQLAELAYRQVEYEYERLERSLKGAEKERYLALKRELAKLDSLKPAPLPVAFAATDLGPQAAPTFIPKKSGSEILPGFLTILNEEPATITPLANSTGRRSALARWLSDAKNPLTARVMVNRLWQQLMGRGLAASSSDFGRLGEVPTHPELLDWLASEFVRPASGPAWSLKHLIRLIVTSETYQQSANHPQPQAGRLRDPENKLYWRGTVRRLDAEQIRDTLLAVSGELDQKRGGPGGNSNDNRRSIYTKVLRNNRDPLLDAFDAPYWFQSASSRDVTTTSVQSLLLFNNQLLLQRARAVAERAFREEPSDSTQRMVHLYRMLFGRVPTTQELQEATRFLSQQALRIGKPSPDQSSRDFRVGKIPYRDGQAAEIKLNDHPGFSVPHTDGFPTREFTIEAFIYPHSIADSGAVRTIAAKWDGDPNHSGWVLGITGKQSRRKPQTLVLQLFGPKSDGTTGEEALFSDHHIALNKPYYVAAAVTPATVNQPGEVVFSVKDLSNDDEQLLTVRKPHQNLTACDNKATFWIGSRGGKNPSGYDGLIDDVRLSRAKLNIEQLLFTREGLTGSTVGYWAFEPKPSLLADASGNKLDLQMNRRTAAATGNPAKQAWQDLIHALLNSSEFLYKE